MKNIEKKNKIYNFFYIFYDKAKIYNKIDLLNKELKLILLQFLITK